MSAVGFDLIAQIGIAAVVGDKVHADVAAHVPVVVHAVGFDAAAEVEGGGDG